MKRLSTIFSLFLLSIYIFLSGCTAKTTLVTGSYSESGDKGINVYGFNPSDGSLELKGSANAGVNPSYFCFSENRSLIYAINEVSTFKDSAGGGLTTLKYEGNFGNIKKVNEMPFPNGGPCFISVSPDDRFLLIANYGGGSVAVIRLDESGIPVSVSDTVIFEPDGERVSHAHMVSFDPQGERVYVSDLGLDRMMIYSFDNTSGKLIPVSENGVGLTRGTGPRHFTFDQNGKFIYLVGELNSTVTVLRVDNEAGLIPVQTISTLNPGFTGSNSGADIHMGNTGEYLYASNRGENSIVTFKVNQDGLLSFAGSTGCGGNWPRNFVIDQNTGIPSGEFKSVDAHSPVCLKFRE
jgi:6-phosphogluconolactonase